MKIMKRHKTAITISIIIIVIICIGYYFVELGDSEDWENNVVDKEINQLLAAKNRTTINKVSANKTTKEFLLHLKRGEKAKHTSGFQGLTPNNMKFMYRVT